MLNRRLFAIAGLVACAGCSNAKAQAPGTLAESRAKFKTTIHYASANGGGLDAPPKKLFKAVTYPSAVGDLAAYITPDPGDGQKHPAIIWMTGGETNSIGDVWSPRPLDNDQSASAYVKAGIVTMFPSLRGGNRNPGQIEGLYGEVDDVLAAADYLASQPYVDPNRIYLGGHSTGGTLVLLTAETRGDRFRAVFSFGPVHDTAVYGQGFVPRDFTTLPAAERELRAPVLWLTCAAGRLFVIEGDQGNVEALRIMKEENSNPAIDFIEVPGAGHFDVLGPANEVIAQKILSDSGPAANITLSAHEISSRLSQG
ncbi:S9 family peptidase [Asticcacaulis sp. AC402]|uniref:alpha/beta hydrolase family protein n=1 Tax=Asticcacaulis sp. AC402 TaxID=1282361 RepID=UPI0003C40A8F|nr:prolyl oligopeptidase family serine peptidase [Asticcacaulis sp. AC402]ESQ75335.1 hypothetical protein ABAC402_09525 [Asticcacaulis sp. AC402]